MVNKEELVKMLIEALSFEEITVSGLLQAFLREIKDSRIDDLTQTEMEIKITRMLRESTYHSKMLTSMMKKVMNSEQREF